jgi:hypothetical protein
MTTLEGLPDNQNALRLQQAVEVYERTLKQDPSNDNLSKLRGEIIRLNPSQEFTIDPFIRITLPEKYTDTVKSHIRALKRATEETLPPPEISALALETLESSPKQIKFAPKDLDNWGIRNSRSN